MGRKQASQADAEVDGHNGIYNSRKTDTGQKKGHHRQTGEAQFQCNFRESPIHCLHDNIHGHVGFCKSFRNQRSHQQSQRSEDTKDVDQSPEKENQES